MGELVIIPQVEKHCYEIKLRDTGDPVWFVAHNKPVLTKKWLLLDDEIIIAADQVVYCIKIEEEAY